MNLRDYETALTKSDLQTILSMLPNTADNAEAINNIVYLLQRQGVNALPYTYSVSFAALAAGGASPVSTNLAITNDADFLVLAQTFDANIANAGQTFTTGVLPLVKVLMANSSTGTNYMNQSVSVPSIFGPAVQPFILPQPLRIVMNSQITITANNYDAANIYNLNLNFIGVKLFAAPAFPTGS